MSTTAEIFVLFKNRPSLTRLADLNSAIWNRTIFGNGAGDFCRHLAEVEDADLLASVEDDGSFEFLPRARCAPLLGRPSLQGRLFVFTTMARVWNDEWTIDGPGDQFAVLMLTLLQQSDVAFVWYGDEKYQEGVKLDAMTHQKAHDLLDAYVRLGTSERVLQVFKQVSGQWGGRILQNGTESGRIAGCLSDEDVADQAREQGLFPDRVQNLDFVPEVQ